MLIWLQNKEAYLVVKKLETKMSDLLDASNSAEKMEEINIEVKKILDEQIKKCPENVEKAIENYPTCMICMENFKEDDWDKVMICGPNGHPFHDTCILQWLNNQNNPLCPICKQPWFGDPVPVPVRRNNIRRTQVMPLRRPIPVATGISCCYSTRTPIWTSRSSITSTSTSASSNSRSTRIS